MDGTSSEFLVALNLLLPGFVAAWVVVGLTPSKKGAPQFERIVEAVMFTTVMNAVFSIVRYHAYGEFDAFLRNNQLSSLVALAIVFGFVYFLNIKVPKHPLE